jgi:hypothetical protein
MFKRALRLAAASLLASALTGCTNEPEPQVLTTLILSATPRTIDNKGQSTTLGVFALDEAGNPGTGDVQLTTTAGFFGNEQKSTTATLDAQGRATTTFRCPVAQDSSCQGFVTVQGAWKQLSSETRVRLLSSTTPPPDNSDAGVTDGGNPDAGDPIIVSDPANIVFLAAGSKPKIGIRSSGLETSTPMSFVVMDLEGKPVPDVDVRFSVSGPAGARLSATSAKTGPDGEASILLEAGDEVGIATVTAQTTSPSGVILSVRTQGTPIVGARASDKGFMVECAQINLAANASPTPPRKDLTTKCSVQLRDRFSNPVSWATSVNWYAEAGSIQSPVSTTEAEENPGHAVTTFSTAGKWPPVPVHPLSPSVVSVPQAQVTEEPEPFEGDYNPRDMLVTVIAVTSGEEEFYDGSGVSNAEKNGKWEPGEWFVDVPEPFLDANDNQVYDLGEMFIDTERLDCATGAYQPKNGKWDGPNGCWDGDIMLWRPTHILYSGFSSHLPARWTFNPAPDYTVPRKHVKHVTATVTDAYFNRISPDAATITVKRLGTAGELAVAAVDHFINSRTYGFEILHEPVEIFPDANQPRGYSIRGTCDPSKAQTSTDPKLARCTRQYRFGRFKGFDNEGILKLKGIQSETEPGEIFTAWVVISNNHTSAIQGFMVTME